MTDNDGEPLFEAIRSSLSQRPPEFDEAGVRRRVLLAHASGRRPEVPRARYRWAFAGVALTALAVAVWALRWPRPTTFEVAGRSGLVGSALEAGSAKPLALVFSEGTRVLLGVGSRGRVEALTPLGARIELERGFVSANVVHQPRTDWTFVAGPFQVAVLGTQLDVAWAPRTQQFELRVSRGVVRVKGPLLSEGQEVRAGQTCRVDLVRNRIELGASGSAEAREVSPRPAASAESPASALPPAPSAQLAPSAAAPSAVVESARPAWLALVRSGKPVDAIAAAERTGLVGTIARPALKPCWSSLALRAFRVGPKSSAPRCSPVVGAPRGSWPRRRRRTCSAALQRPPRPRAGSRPTSANNRVGCSRARRRAGSWSRMRRLVTRAVRARRQTGIWPRIPMVRKHPWPINCSAPTRGRE